VFYLNDFVFKYDPLVGDHYGKGYQNPHNPASLDHGILTLTLNDGVYEGSRDIFISE
jgi:hypothetical protein